MQGGAAGTERPLAKSVRVSLGLSADGDLCRGWLGLISFNDGV